MGLNADDPAGDEPQHAYARWLNAGTGIAFAVSLATLLVYLSGQVTPFIPLERLPEFWGLPVAQYLESTGAPGGWGWLRLLGFSDYLNFVGVGLFASISALCFLRTIPSFLRRGERLHAGLALAQVLVLLAAASGWFAGGR